MERLRELAETLRVSSGPEREADIAFLLRKAELLESALTRTRKALKEFRDEMELDSRRTDDAYEEARERARGIFS